MPGMFQRRKLEDRRRDDVTLSGELNAYGRRILIRIATGVAASIVGYALLGWGILHISIENKSFSEIANACSAGTTSCTSLTALINVAIAMLFGFSERGLASLETKLLGR
jgi:hypothetical protein